MIVYCGLRHFYLRHFMQADQFADSRSAESQITEPQIDAYYILTHNNEIWDFSPELKEFGFSRKAQGKEVLHLDRPVLTVPINLKDFVPFAQKWHEFTQYYTSELEVEYPHAWYLRFKQPTIFEQFVRDFIDKLQEEEGGGIWGAGKSKLVAKLAAHNLTGSKRVVAPEQTLDFLDKLPLRRLPLVELVKLEKLGIKTIGELAKIPLVELSNQFGAKAADLQRLGYGEDLIPFQTEQPHEYSWTLDCTTLDGFLRPLEPWELQPHLQKGVEKLSSTLKKRQQVAGNIQIEACLAHGTSFEKKRQFKEETDEAELLKRAVNALLPTEPIAQIDLVVSDLMPSPLVQLGMFWGPQTAKLTKHELAEITKTQVGVGLSRREKLLFLWEEYFS